MTRHPNGPARPQTPMPDDDPPEEWNEEILEDSREEDQQEPVPPS